MATLSSSGPTQAEVLSHSPLDVERIRKDFPVLSQTGKRRLVYLDSAASSQRPQVVLEKMDEYYNTTHANVHRGVYEMAEEATARYEAARKAVGRFVNAPDPSREVVFTKNATESLNLVASSWGRMALKPGDVVLLTIMEHHANLVPWQMLAEREGIQLRFIDIDDDGYLDLSRLDQAMEGVKAVAVTLASNVMGTLVNLDQIVEAAHGQGAVVVADGAQYVPHLPTDVQRLGCDFLAFSGHKMLGPTGIGVLWAKEDLLEKIPPFLGGGEMISDVRLDGFSPAEVPWKFEAGTPPIAEAIGLHEAIKYLEQIGMEAVREHDIWLTEHALATLEQRHGEHLKIWGPKQARDRTGVISFAVDDVHPHDVSQILDNSGVCVRAGHHCAKPLMRRLGVAATTRASFSIYNDLDDIEALADAIGDVIRLLGR
jgi:cysteine desulfurase/selenocysteine lyase